MAGASVGARNKKDPVRGLGLINNTDALVKNNVPEIKKTPSGAWDHVPYRIFIMHFESRQK